MRRDTKRPGIARQLMPLIWFVDLPDSPAIKGSSRVKGSLNFPRGRPLVTIREPMQSGSQSLDPKVRAAAKQRAEEGGEPVAAADVTEVLTELAPDQTVAPAAEAPAAPAASSAPAHKPTGNADRSLMKRGTYCGVVDTGPVPGETQQQKIARLAALSAAAKQRSEGG